MSFSALEGVIEGLDDAVGRARREAKPFDYAATIAGLRATDRYTLQIRLTRPDPTFVYNLAYGGLSAVPREVVEAEGAEFSRKAVGSGPYQMARFQPGTRLDVVRTPAQAAAVGALRAECAHRRAAGKGDARRTVPMVERVEMLRIPEPSTAVLALTRREIDMVVNARPALVYDATTLKAPLREAGIRAERAPDQGMYLLQFNMRDATIGGMAPAQVALRRAIAMAIDDGEWLRTFEQGIGTVRQHIIGPDTAGHDPSYRNPNAYDPPTANALLDRMGYKRGADGRAARRQPAQVADDQRRDLRIASAGGVHEAQPERHFDQAGLRLDAWRGSAQAAVDLPVPGRDTVSAVARPTASAPWPTSTARPSARSTSPATRTTTSIELTSDCG